MFGRLKKIVVGQEKMALREHLSLAVPSPWPRSPIGKGTAQKLAPNHHRRHRLSTHLWNASIHRYWDCTGLRGCRDLIVCSCDSPMS